MKMVKYIFKTKGLFLKIENTFDFTYIVITMLRILLLSGKSLYYSYVPGIEEN
jgi:hypothetical protein